MKTKSVLNTGSTKRRIRRKPVSRMFFESSAWTRFVAIAAFFIASLIPAVSLGGDRNDSVKDFSFGNSLIVSPGGPSGIVGDVGQQELLQALFSSVREMNNQVQYSAMRYSARLSVAYFSAEVEDLATLIQSGPSSPSEQKCTAQLERVQQAWFGAERYLYETHSSLPAIYQQYEQVRKLLFSLQNNCQGQPVLGSLITPKGVRYIALFLSAVATPWPQVT